MIGEVLSFIFNLASIKSVLLAVVVALTVYWLIQKRKYKLPPGPFAFPLIGNYELYLNKMQHKEYLKLRKKYGPVLRVNMGPSMWVFLNDIKVTLEAMVKRGADFADRPSLGSTDLFSGDGKDIVMGKYGPTWKLHRKIAGKALRHYLQGRQMEETVQAACKKVIDGMVKEEGAFNPSKYYDLLVFNVICAVCFGRSYELEDKEFLRVMELESEMLRLGSEGTLEDLVPSIGKIWHTQAYRNMESVCNEMHDFIRKKMKEHKDTFDKNNIRDFTDSLILARIEAEEEDDKELLSHLTDERLMFTLVDIFIAGVDTSRLTTNWAILHMATFPDIQEKVQDELDSVVGKNRFPTLQDRDKLCYTEATLYESMRLNTAITVGVPHKTLCDTTVGGYDIPKDTTIMINHWALLHDPEFWKDVDKFDPHRFLDSDGKLSPKPESWLPFSAGRRVCLGEGVAKPELFLIFATLLQKFKFKLPPGTVGKLEEDPAFFGAVPLPYDLIVEERY